MSDIVNIEIDFDRLREVIDDRIEDAADTVASYVFAFFGTLHEQIGNFIDAVEAQSE